MEKGRVKVNSNNKEETTVCSFSQFYFSKYCVYIKRNNINETYVPVEVLSKYIQVVSMKILSHFSMTWITSHPGHIPEKVLKVLPHFTVIRPHVQKNENLSNSFYFKFKFYFKFI